MKKLDLKKVEEKKKKDARAFREITHLKKYDVKPFRNTTLKLCNFDVTYRELYQREMDEEKIKGKER